jgi:hypothetical protein
MIGFGSSDSNQRFSMCAACKLGLAISEAIFQIFVTFSLVDLTSLSKYAAHVALLWTKGGWGRFLPDLDGGRRAGCWISDRFLFMICVVCFQIFTFYCVCLCDYVRYDRICCFSHLMLLLGNLTWQEHGGKMGSWTFIFEKWLHLNRVMVWAG